MAFIRERVIKGKTSVAKYYQVLETYQEDGRKKQRVVLNLGKLPSLEVARAEAQRQGYKDILTLPGEKNVKGNKSVKGNVKEPRGSVKGSVKKIAGESVKGSTPKRLPWLKIRAVDTDGLTRTVGPNPTAAIFTEGPLKPVKRRFRPRPIPEEAQRIIGEISELMASRADDELIIEKVKELLQVSRCGPRHWLAWIDRERLDHLLKEARRRIPRKVREGKGPAAYDVLPPPPPGEAWDKRYWTRFTLVLIAAKVRGDAEQIARRIFFYYPKTRRITLSQASLVYRILSEKPDQSLEAWEFHREYTASDFEAMVAQIKRRGQENASTRLSEEQVKEIRERYARGRTTYRALAEEFGTSQENIYLIVKGKIWKSTGWEKEARSGN
jgi:hypothetical protein